jgi:hypothetical protein
MLLGGKYPTFVVRKDQRFPTFGSAHIVVDGGNKLLKCKLRDLSDKGAALAVRSADGIPSRFDLLFQTSELVHGCRKKKMVLRECVVEWSNGDKIGVSFA